MKGRVGGIDEPPNLLFNGVTLNNKKNCTIDTKRSTPAVAHRTTGWLAFASSRRVRMFSPTNPSLEELGTHPHAPSAFGQGLCESKFQKKPNTRHSTWHFFLTSEALAEVVLLPFGDELLEATPYGVFMPPRHPLWRKKASIDKKCFSKIPPKGKKHVFFKKKTFLKQKKTFFFVSKKTRCPLCL